MEALLERMQREGQGRNFLTSCEAELQELMKQIDIMVAHKKAEWESQTQALGSCLVKREQEVSTLRNALDDKRKEIERLYQRLEGMEQLNHEMTIEYEHQLNKVQEELAKLKRSYEKLQKKQLKEARQLSKSHVEDSSEVSILTKKLEEFHQKSLDWETQRLHYQQHVASLEAQRKAFAEQSDLFQAQLSNRKQIFESVKLANQSEIHHLTSKLERANDTICANELEVERLNMKVEDLNDVNQKIREEQWRVEDELKISRNSLEVLQEEKMELRATLLSQDDFINGLRIQNEQLQKDVSRLTETLHTKEALISMGSADTIYLQLSKELTENCHKLQLTEEHLCQAKTEIKKLKEQLFHMEQSHSSELEGMKQEVSQLTRELHQRDITIASSKGSALGLEQQLRTEIEKAEQMAMERRAILSQLEALKQEHQHLSEMLQKAKSTPLAELPESYTKALNKVETENQRLQKELEGTQASFDTSSWVSKDTHERIVQQMQCQMTEIKNAESRRIQELQCKHEEEIRAHRARYDKTVQNYEEELLKSQRLLARAAPVSSTAAGVSPQISRSNSVEFLSCDPLLESGSLPHANREFAYVSSIISSERECLPLCPLPTANIGAIAAKFLEDEEVRSQHILDRLDAHIEELKRESEKTVQQFTHQK
ncbi:centrosomal protein of 63 kDa isoform X3 [Tiliqua scincoides]|uniref:centrosomal protein of 63 kDa isoform X3 n=1 Tax=Tiliqua scincoides TaxID=71010 RepID=UPI00346373C2